MQLRYFETFAVIINLIHYAVKDTFTYIIIFLIIIAGFANSLFILAMIESPDTSDLKITGPNLFTAFMATFGGHIYHETHMHYQYVFGIFQIFLTGICDVILLHLLVSILEHIHSHVSALYKSERLRTKCRLINENAIFFRRADVFRETKYVIRVEADAGAHGGDSHEGSNEEGGHVHGGGNGGLSSK